jgi:hypothetical protein
MLNPIAWTSIQPDNDPANKDAVSRNARLPRKPMKQLAVTRAPARLAALALVGATVLTGCSLGLAQESRTAVTKVQIVPYGGRYAELFDDRIDRLSLDTGTPTMPARDELLKHRAQAADYILRVRVLSLTTDRGVDRSIHHILVEPVGVPVAGRSAAQSTFDLTVRDDNPFFAVLSRLGSRLAGRGFIAYLKQFSGPSEPEVHWFMSAESAEVVTAIRDAHLLMEVRASNP